MRYYWEEDYDGGLYIYLRTYNSDNQVFGRTAPLCIVPAIHGVKKQKSIADFIVDALNRKEAPLGESHVS